MPRKKLMNNAIRSEADFRKVLAAICLDLGHALDHFTLFKNLMAAKQGAYTKAVSQSQTFWSLVYGALQDATLFRLCRAYDQDDGALTMPARSSGTGPWGMTTPSPTTTSTPCSTTDLGL
jgi:hypothetical protein